MTYNFYIIFSHFHFKKIKLYSLMIKFIPISQIYKLIIFIDIII